MATPGNYPYGLELVEQDGKQYRVRRYTKKTGAALYQGDAVIADAAGNVTVATAGATLLGVAMESLASSDTSSIAICDDPDAIFRIRASGNFTSADVFQNANITANAADTTISRSKHDLNVSSLATTNTLQLKVIGLHNHPSNAYGSYADVLVRFNNHQFSTGVVGV